MTTASDRSRACDRVTDERLAQLATRVLGPGPDIHELSTEDLCSLLLELRGRRQADPTLDELTALVDVRDRLVRIVTSGLAEDPNARLAKKYLDRVLLTFLVPLLERGSQRLQ